MGVLVVLSQPAQVHPSSPGLCRSPPFHLDECDESTVEECDEEEGDEGGDGGPDIVGVVQIAVVIRAVISDAAGADTQDRAVPGLC